MGYGLAKNLAGGVAKAALDVVPGGKVITSVLKKIPIVGGLLGGGPPDAKAMERARKAGHAAAAGDQAALLWLKQAAAGGSKYASVQQRAQDWLNVLAKSGGSRSDGWLQVKAQGPVLQTGAGPMNPYGDPTYGSGTREDPYRGSPENRTSRRRRRRSSYRAHSRKAKTHRKSRTTKRRRATSRSRKLKFGSRAWRQKYLGHK